MKNPFQNVGRPVFVDSEYVQRQNLFNRLVSHVNDHTSLGALYGLPRTGKTSIAFRLGQHFKAASTSVHFLYVDLSRVAHENHFARFWRDAQIKLAREIGSPVQVNMTLDQIGYERDKFLDLVEEVRDRNEWVLLVIDEFCTCLKYDAEEANEFIDDFRSMIAGDGIVTRDLRESICCLTISRRRPEYIQSKTGGSTFANAIAQRFEVGVFTHDEFENQCAMVPDMTADQVSRLSELTHRHPYVSALVDKVLFSEKCSVDAAWDKVSSVVSGYYDDVSKLIAEATEAGVYVPDELKDRCRGGSHLEHCTKDAEDHGLHDSSNVGQTTNCPAYHCAECPLVVVDLKTGVVYVGEKEIPLEPPQFMILMLSLVGLDKTDWIGVMGSLVQCPDEWPGVSWYQQFLKCGGKYYYRQTDEAIQDFEKRTENLRNQQMNRLRNSLEKLLNGYLVLPSGKSRKNLPEECLKWKFGTEGILYDEFPEDCVPSGILECLKP